MRSVFIPTLIFFLSINTLFAQNENRYSVLISEAMEFYKAHKFEESKEKFTEAFNIRQDNQKDVYNGACSAASSGDQQLAIQWLNKAIDLGWNNASHMEKDCDLYSLRILPDWKDLLDRVRDNKKSIKDKEEVIDQICSLIVKDQSDEIWKLGSEDFIKNTNKEDFNTTIQKIHQQLVENDIEDLCDLKSKFSTNTQYLNGKLTSTFSKTFLIIPQLVYHHKFLNNSYGHILDIKLSNDELSDWRLNNLTYDENYIDKGKNPREFVRDFFSNADTIYVGFEIVSGEEYLLGNNICLNTDFKVDLVKIFSNMTYFGTTYKQPIDDTLKIYSIFFRKLSSDDIFDTVKSKFKTLTLQYTFNNNVDSKILISYDNDYAFYLPNDLQQIITFIHKIINKKNEGYFTK